MTTTCVPESAGQRMPLLPPSSRRAVCTADAVHESVPQLRHFAVFCVRRFGVPPDAADTVGLVVSELVTNAVLHSGSRSVAVLVGLEAAGLLIAVRDHGSWRERPRPRLSSADDRAPCGRGLALVSAVTERCTISSGTTGTLVEAHLRLAEHPVAHGGDR
ncbi:ATP-binding protein [Kitasatospora sp. NPDC058965]|uniref:ATP-binding protein n=1 Tax=Kitasatospora sp. NPDC058965 TaxID=3346682 RepID=UPI003675405B